MADIAYRKFVEQWKLITDLPPQKLGPLTDLYQKITIRLKVMPWPLFVVGALLTVGGLYLLWGTALTRVVSLLQRGF
jgi:hypothetical protein